MSMNQELSAGGVGESGVVLQITTVDGRTRETVLPGVTVEGWMKENVQGRGETVIESDPIEATVVFADGTEVAVLAYLDRSSSVQDLIDALDEDEPELDDDFDPGYARIGANPRL